MANKTVNSIAKNHLSLDRLVLSTNTKSFSDWLKRWSLEMDLVPFPLGVGCCALEYQASYMGRFSEKNRELSLPETSAAQSDLLIIAGTITEKILPNVLDIYNEMPSDKYVMAVGACASSGGAYNSYSVVQGISEKIPVDVFVPGCPPHPLALIEGIRLIKERIKNGVNAKTLFDHKIRGEAVVT